MAVQPSIGHDSPQQGPPQLLQILATDAVTEIQRKFNFTNVDLMRWVGRVANHSAGCQ